ncbi:hypothetical protein BOTBODRAFT_100243, partial [Botryobasidium botryosum FD-172 SS1]
VLTYPPNEKGSINIHVSELNRLEPGEYLNDTLIEFGLKHWLNSLKENNPELAEDVHVFSSFFYKKLLTKKYIFYSGVFSCASLDSCFII